MLCWIQVLNRPMQKTVSKKDEHTQVSQEMSKRGGWDWTENMFYTKDLQMHLFDPTLRTHWASR